MHPLRVEVFLPRFLLFLIFFMCTSSAENPNRQVLPTNVKPTHYDLTLQPNLKTFEFHGQVKVK